MINYAVNADWINKNKDKDLGILNIAFGNRLYCYQMQ